MKHLIYDTNILILLIRKPSILQFLKRKYPQNQFIPIISVITEGELASFAIQNNWGEWKMKTLTNLLNQFLVLPIQAKSVIEAYAKIDAFSQNKLIEKPLALSARNMGKNDLWIAATTFVVDATLITTDQDFIHLKNTFINIDLLEVSAWK